MIWLKLQHQYWKDREWNITDDGDEDAGGD